MHTRTYLRFVSIPRHTSRGLFLNFKHREGNVRVGSCLSTSHPEWFTSHREAVAGPRVKGEEEINIPFARELHETSKKVILPEEYEILRTPVVVGEKKKRKKKTFRALSYSTRDHR